MKFQQISCVCSCFLSMLMCILVMEVADGATFRHTICSFLSEHFHRHTKKNIVEEIDEIINTITGRWKRDFSCLAHRSHHFDLEGFGVGVASFSFHWMVSLVG